MARNKRPPLCRGKVSEHDHRNLRQSKFLRRGQPGVSGNHDVVWTH